MKKILDLAFFPGFYGTLYDASDPVYYEIEEEINYLKEERGITLNQGDFNFDFKKYQEDVAKVFVNIFKETYPIDIIKDITYDHIWSPRYYNFENDELYAAFEFSNNCKEKMRKFMDDNHDLLEKIILDEHSSRDGYCSFMDNRVDGWYERLFDVPEDEIDERYLGEMVKYMIAISYEKDYFEKAHTLSEDIFMYVWDEIYLSEYIDITKEGFYESLEK